MWRDLMLLVAFGLAVASFVRSNITECVVAEVPPGLRCLVWGATVHEFRNSSAFKRAADLQKKQQ